MKRKSITIYTIIISIIFAFCVGFFAYNVTYEYNHGKERVRKTKDFVINTIKKDGERTNFNRLFDNLNDYEAIYIQKNDMILFAYPNENAKNVTETNFVNIYKTSFSSGTDKYQIQLALYTLRPSVIFYYARFSFITILFATIFSIILIIYYAVTSKNTSHAEEKSAEYKSENKASSVKEEKSESPFDNVISSEKTENTLQNEEEISEEEEKIIEEKASEIIKENKAEDPYEANTIPVVSNIEEEIRNLYSVPSSPVSEEISVEKDVDNEAKDLFSSKTGFSNESQLGPRLETELIHAASEEQDLALLLIKIPGINFESPVIKDLTKYLLNENLFRNLIFDFKEDGFAIIRKSMTIDEAETYADKVAKDITEILESENLKCYIGISSRSIRMLSNERLIKEAESALNHSLEDESSQITAFHVDIEKYREFLRNKTED